MTETAPAPLRPSVVFECLRKLGYARAVAEYRAALQGTRAYPCDHCGQWHVALKGDG